MLAVGVYETNVHKQARSGKLAGVDVGDGLGKFTALWLVQGDAVLDFI